MKSKLFEKLKKFFSFKSKEKIIEIECFSDFFTYYPQNKQKEVFTAIMNDVEKEQETILKKYSDKKFYSDMPKAERVK